MKRILAAICCAVTLALTPALQAEGWETVPSHAHQNAGFGALIGGVVGALVAPHANRHGYALIGAGLAGTVGYMIGRDQDRQPAMAAPLHGYDQPSPPVIAGSGYAPPASARYVNPPPIHIYAPR